MLARRRSISFAFILACTAASSACTDPETADATTGSEEEGVNPETSATSSAETSSAEAGSAGTSSGDGDGDGDTSGEAESGTSGTGGPAGECPVDGKTYACGDGLDNDEDGFTDDNDPECTGPCDDDEGSFQTGIPGDNVDCKQDCFFDGNSGQGGGDCSWDLKCDPENPGAAINCEYTGGNNCENKPPSTSDSCVETCGAVTPNGCDCFGCCEVDTPEGKVNIFLGSSPDCSIENLEACESCTPVDACLNPCDPTDCELCFGETTLPPGCVEPTCPDGTPPCNTDPGPDEPTCPAGLFCITGCCLSFVPPD